MIVVYSWENYEYVQVIEIKSGGRKDECFNACGENKMIDGSTEVQMDKLDWPGSKAFNMQNIIAIRIKIEDME